MGIMDFFKKVGRGIKSVFKPAGRVISNFKPITQFFSKLPGVRSVVNTAKNALNTGIGVFDDVANTMRSIPVVGDYVDKALDYKVGGKASLNDVRNVAGRTRRVVNDYT